MAPPSLGVLCFRRRFDGREPDALNRRLAALLEESGIGLVSTTRLRGRLAIRMCILNHTTRREDVERVLEFLERADVQAEVDEGIARHERHPDVRRSWLERPPARGKADGVERTLLEGLPLFSGLDPEQSRFAASLAATREIAAGTTVIEAWDVARDFFVVLDGRADVFVDGTRVDGIRPGDFFGELAALDWGAGFAYPRLATVVAATPMRLLVFADGRLNELMKIPAVEKTISAAVRKRLAGL
jgi:hypothetical protein